MTLNFNTIELENLINIMNAATPEEWGTDCQWLNIKAGEVSHNGKVAECILVRMTFNFCTTGNPSRVIEIKHYDGEWVSFNDNEISMDELKNRFIDELIVWENMNNICEIPEDDNSKEELSDRVWYLYQFGKMSTEEYNKWMELLDW